ncbi:long-chain-fatty-acid--ligase 5 [Stylonychia lemnae]|uniref:Long-chain-fatty-acid--ligase 5 n=1 Tax=Stylonychia lemnae TaxID=5949 RepID=A0A078AF03_STYLE|nr:long-chain-fatty-acid--ligase 5 [Stylonychia lemnae]|eukprot:CDW80102.1 long-chain-fatty-acid--ligase 5 [Stylonychia lemnae]
MGNTQIERQYAVFRTDKQPLPGHSPELVNPNKEGRPYEWKTFREVYDLMDLAARGIASLNLSPEIETEGTTWKFLGIHSRNREEWTVMNLACLRSAITIVPFFDSLGKDALSFVINQAELQTMCIESKNFENLINLQQDGKIPSLKSIVIFEGVTITQRQRAESQGIRILSFQDVLHAGEIHKEVVLNGPLPDSIYMFIYTSGTTGDPKAAMISHKNLIGMMHHMDYNNQMNGATLTETDVCMSYLPLAHSFEQGTMLVSLNRGYSHGFYSGDPLKLFEDMQELKPTYIAAVPRILTRVYQKIMDGVNAKGGVAKWLFEKAVSDKIATYQSSGHLTHKFYDKVVFKKVKDIFGGNLRIMLSGSASLDAKVLLFFRVALGFYVFEGYAQTETTLCGTITSMHDYTTGNVGTCSSVNKLRLKDVPEMNYYHTDSPPRGELQIKGAGNIIGYFKNEEKTKELISEDGWLCSGDVVVILPNGNVQIIDRAKNIFKLSQGEYIAPEKLQNIYAQSVFIQQIYVHGDLKREYLVAVVVPDPDSIKRTATSKGIATDDYNQLLNNSDIKKVVLDEMNKMATNFSLTGLERIKKVHLTSTTFNTENDLATPTMKVKRFNVKKYFEKELEELYID